MRYNYTNIDLSYKGINDIYACGDLHGDFDAIRHEIKTKDFKNCFIIICGDISMGFNRPGYYNMKFSSMQKDFSERNIYVIMFRGNHDDPAWFEWNAPENDIDYPNIILVRDYSIITFNENVRALFIGGARSVDRYYRIWNHWKYWPDEEVKPLKDETVKLCGEKKVNYVFSHTAPKYLDAARGKLPQDLIDYYKELGDKDLEYELKAEREYMADIYDKLSAVTNITKWFCGHFHTHSESEYNGTKFVCLDMFRENISSERNDLTKPWLRDRKTKADYYKVF